MKIKHILDLYLGLGRNVVPEKNQIPAKGYKKGRRYSREELLGYHKKGYSFGWVLGPRDIVFDVDPRNGGERSLEKLLRKLGLDCFSGNYPTVLTGGGGYHYYMTLPRKINGSELKTELKRHLPGIECLREGNKVTIPGSTHHKTGRRYKFDKQSPFESKSPLVKKSLLKIYIKKKQRKSNVPRETQSELKALSSKDLYGLLKYLPVSEYSIHEDWLNIMMSAHAATNGRGLRAFLKWSLSDPSYSGEEAHITQRWNSLKPGGGITVKTLLKEARKHGAKGIERLFPPEDIEQKIARNLLENRFEGGKRLLHGADQRYWHYTGTHWEVLAPNLIGKYLLKEIEDLKARIPNLKKAIAPLLSNSERILRAMCASKCNLHEVIDRRQSVINTLNYELWVNESDGDIELREHSPGSNLVFCLNVEYEPRAKCKRFDSALRDIFSGHDDTKDLVRHYWELMGYMIQNKKNIPAWVLFHGPGRNGKKVLIQVPVALLGKAVSSKSIQELNVNRNSHALASLPGKLAIVDDDVAHNAVLPDGMLKRISENKSLSANPKGGSEFEFISTALVIMAANNWPRTRDLSEGMRRRAMVFHLKKRFSDQEADLDLVDNIIDTELAGVLNRCLKGFKRLRDRGYFLVPASCKRAAHMWFSSSSQVHQFIDENLDVSSKQRIMFKSVWERYQIWTVDNGVDRNHSYSKHYLKRLLQDLKFKLKKSTGNKLYLYGYSLKDLEM